MMGIGMPLAMASCGEALIVRSVRGGRNRRQRLASMGILPGCEVVVISKSDGPMVVDIKGSRLAIGQGLAGSIIV